MDWRRDNIERRLGAPPNSVPNLVFLNWTAPALVKSEFLDCHISVLSWALHESTQSMALALQPVFTYNRGKLRLEEKKMLECLNKGSHNLDRQFSVLFSEKSSDRDLRPMCYPGRLIFPSPIGDPGKNVFFDSKLRRTERAEA